MKISTIKKLQRFVGRIGTIITVAGKQGFSDTQFSDFFTGLIESIDEDGIFVSHPATGEGAFFALAHVVGITKEQVLDPSNPEHALIIEELKKAPPEQLMTMPVKTQGHDFDLMNKLAQQAQKKMVRKD